MISAAGAGKIVFARIGLVAILFDTMSWPIRRQTSRLKFGLLRMASTEAFMPYGAQLSQRLPTVSFAAKAPFYSSPMQTQE